MFLEGLQLGKYCLQRLVGQGAAGMVYLADDLRLPRQVALKIVQGDDASVESLAETRRLFQREAKAIAQLNHPNILPLFDFGEEIIQGVTFAYLVTPFCPDGSLVKWFQTHNILSPSDVIALIQQAASALAYAHEHGIVHRDVKPSNFLVRVHNTMPNRPDLLLADFGIARFTNATVNASKTIRGTPTYMAPEQWSGDPVAASDQYSLAVMAYELLTGRPPFTGTQNQIMYHHLITYPQPPSMVNPQLSPALDGVLLRALAKQSEARYPTVTEFASALQQVELHTPDVVSQPPRVITPQVIAPVAVRDTPNTSPMPPTEDELEETQASLMQHARTTDIPIIEPLPHLPPARINWKMLSLIGLVAMLVIASFIGFSSFNSGRSANGHATAVQALQNTHATATAQANIQATSTAQAAATAAVTSNPYDPDFNKLVFYDQLTVNTDKHWDETSTRCSFAADGYHVLSSTQTIQPCIHHDANFDDMTFQMKMTIVKGSGGGLLFHAGSAGAYYFRINQDRTYALFACTSSGSSCTKTLRSGYSSWITPGLNQSNILDVVTVGQDFYLYVNVHEIDWVNDPTSPNGQFGGLAEAQSETVFSDLKVWTV